MAEQAREQQESPDRDEASGDRPSARRANMKSAGDPPREHRTRRPGGPQVAVLAADQLVQLTGKQYQGIVGLGRADDGWHVEVEVLEMRRIPDTTDVLSSYEVDVDDEGVLQGYRRLRRYLRGEAEGS